jgi:hypothetical protein
MGRGITFGKVQDGVPGPREGGLQRSGGGEEEAGLRLAGCRAVSGGLRRRSAEIRTASRGVGKVICRDQECTV